MKSLQVSAIVLNVSISRIKGFFSFLLLLWPCLSCTAYSSDTLKVMFYNVENLFDCQDDTLKDDSEYLPGGIKGWNNYRYRQKLTRLSQVIAAVGDTRFPDIVALCEVENDSTMEDLIHHSPLFASGYEYQMTNSPDARGVDVALLYQPDRFHLLASRAITIQGGERPTRDILHVVGVLPTADTLDLFVCHFPSRRGGSRQSEPFRELAASILCQVKDSVEAIRQNPRFIVMGDFNDALVGTRIGKQMRVTDCSDNTGISTDFSLLFDLIHGLNPGTYAYQGRWETIDHILVSSTLLDKQSNVHTSPGYARIAAYPFLLEMDEKYGMPVPFRTHLGGRYLGGYSDHLPIVADFVMRYK